VTGSFVVVDANMRIDVRLLDVESGKVLLAEEAAGEQAAFFELEKAVVQKVIAAMGVKLGPRERADVGRIHTADFDAFRTFSEGVALFDAADYQKAIEKLESASAKDARFELARHTIAEYEKIVRELRGRAKTIEDTKAEIADLEHKGAAAEQAELVKRLLRVVSETKNSQAERAAGRRRAESGGPAVPDRDPMNSELRLAALYLLAKGHGFRNPGFQELYEVSDRFAMERAADRYAQRFFYEAKAMWPQICPVLDEHERPKLPRLATFDEDLAQTANTLFGGDGTMPKHHRDRIGSFPWGFDERLYIDRRKRSELYFALLRDLERIEPKIGRMKSDYRLAARRFSDALMLDESTSLYKHLAAQTEDPSEIRVYASDVEQNERTAKLLAAAETGSALREVLMLLSDQDVHANRPEPKTIAALSKRDMSDEAKRSLAYARQLPRKTWLLVGDVPIWTLSGEHFLTSGERSDPLRARSIRFYAHEKIGWATAIADGRPFAEPFVAIEIDHRIPSDFWYREAWPKDGFTANAEIPHVGILLGVKDVDVAPNEDRTLVRPMRGHLLAIGPDDIRLIDVRETQKDRSSSRWMMFDGDVIGREALPKALIRKIEVRSAGAKVTAKVDGRSFTFAAKQPIGPGFVGVRIVGRGFAEVRSIILE
jgi:hypothetical protein